MHQESAEKTLFDTQIGLDHKDMLVHPVVPESKTVIVSSSNIQ